MARYTLPDAPLGAGLTVRSAAVNPRSRPAISMLAASIETFVLGLMPDEKWDARYNPASDIASDSRWTIALMMVVNGKKKIESDGRTVPYGTNHKRYMPEKKIGAPKIDCTVPYGTIHKSYLKKIKWARQKYTQKLHT